MIFPYSFWTVSQNPNVLGYQNSGYQGGSIVVNCPAPVLTYTSGGILTWVYEQTSFCPNPVLWAVWASDPPAGFSDTNLYTAGNLRTTSTSAYKYYYIVGVAGNGSLATDFTTQPSNIVLNTDF